MRFNSIVEQHKAISTNEGLLDKLKDIFKPKKCRLTEQEQRQLWDEDNYVRIVNAYLKETLLNPSWQAKHLKETPSEEKSSIAFIGEKNIPDSSALLKSLQGGFNCASEVLRTFDSNTKLRLRLIKELKSLKGSESVIHEKADQIYVANKSNLLTSYAEILKSKGFKGVSCTGIKGNFPYTTRYGGIALCNYKDEPSGNCFIYGPSTSTVDTYVKNIFQLCDLIHDVYSEMSKNYIPYWDNSELEYDSLNYGDEIFEEIYTSQEDYPLEPMEAVCNIAKQLLVDTLMAI